METRAMHTPKIAFVVHCSTSFARTLETGLSSDDLFTYVAVLMQTIPSKVKKSDFKRRTINTVKQGILAAYNKTKKSYLL